MKKTLLLSLSLASAVAFSANDFYVGVGVGVSNKFDKLSSNVKDDFNALTNDSPDVLDLLGISAKKTVTSKNKMMYDVYAGMRVTDHWSAELGYTHFMGNKFEGNVTYRDVADESSEMKIAASSTHKASVVSLSAIGELPLNDTFSLTARAGLGYVRSKQTIYAKVSGFEPIINDQSESLSNSTSKIQPVLGVGFKANLSKNFALGSEYVYMGKTKNTLVDASGERFSTKQNLHKFNLLKATYSF
jgi:opacity protein-like surface antigen